MVMSHELPTAESTLEYNSALNFGEIVQQTIQSLRAKLGKAAVIGTLAAGTFTGFLADAGAARADTLGYPWYNAPCEFGSAGGLTCANPNNPYDLYDWGEYVNGVFQPYRNGYEYRNCTDYVQWKESTVGVTVPSNLGNGGQWYANAPASEQSNTPQAWDAAVVPGNPGHVAFVESVNPDGTITVSEYNHDAHGNGDMRTATASSMGFTKFVNFGVHPSGSNSTPQPTPDLAYNPSNDLPVVSEEDSTNILQYHYQQSGGSWGTAYLGGAFSSPDVAYNPSSYLPVAAVEGSGNSLEYYYQQTDGSWGTAYLGAAYSAPSVVYNPSNNLPVVAVEGANNTLVYYYQQTDGSWGYVNLGAAYSAPTVAYNPSNDLPVIVVEGASNTLEYYYQQSNGSWGSANIGTTYSQPDVKYNPSNDLPVVTSQGSGNTLEYYYQQSNGSWGSVNLGSAYSAPTVAYNPSNNLPVVAVKGANSSLMYYYQQSNGSWGSVNLGAAESGPDVIYNPSNNLPVVAVKGANSSLMYYYQQSNGSWGSVSL
jgi:hypothetical protein